MYSRILSLLGSFLLLNACTDRQVIGDENSPGEASAGTSGNAGDGTNVDVQRGGTSGTGGAASPGAGGSGGTQSDTGGLPLGRCQGSGTMELTLTSVASSSGAPEIKGEWCNGTDTTVYLPGCALFAGDYLTPDNLWQSYGASVVCTWEGTARELAPGARAEQPASAPTASGLSKAQCRLRGTYYVGCTPNKPISEAACTEHFEVLSNELELPAK
jgi:hypothetical protein